MSLEPEEDSELRDLVATTLQSCGILGKIKAQLRSNVYLALDGGKENLKAKSDLRKSNEKLARFVKCSEGRLAVHLVKEFLTFFNLSFTGSVFEPEADLDGSFIRSSRGDLIERLGLAPEVVDEERPLLSEIVRLSKVSVLKSETPSPPTPKKVLGSPFGVVTPTGSLTTPESSLLNQGRSFLGDLPPLQGTNPKPDPPIISSSGTDFLSEILGKPKEPVKESHAPPEKSTVFGSSKKSEEEPNDDIEEEIMEDFNLSVEDSNSEGFTKDESESKSGFSLDKVDYVEDLKK